LLLQNLHATTDCQRYYQKVRYHESHGASMNESSWSGAHEISATGLPFAPAISQGANMLCLQGAIRYQSYKC